jgi:hypothetical protein
MGHDQMIKWIDRLINIRIVHCALVTAQRYHAEVIEMQFRSERHCIETMEAPLHVIILKRKASLHVVRNARKMHCFNIYALGAT